METLGRRHLIAIATEIMKDEIGTGSLVGAISVPAAAPRVVDAILKELAVTFVEKRGTAT